MRLDNVPVSVFGSATHRLWLSMMGFNTLYTIISDDTPTESEDKEMRKIATGILKGIKEDNDKNILIRKRSKS